MQQSAPAISAHPLTAIHKAVLVVGGSLAVAICAHFSVPLPFTPVYLTLANFAVLLVGLTLGSRAGFAALALYLAEGAMGLPVFSPAGPGGIAQLLGPTGGYLIAYPFAAFAAGFIAERLPRKFSLYALAALAGNAVIFAGGIGWLMVWSRGSAALAVQFGLYPFVFAEVMKIMAAAGAKQVIGSRL
jgi:biotin transport system substrate-specific component